MRNLLILPLLGLLAASCESQLGMHSFHDGSTHVAMEEMSTEIADLKHALNAAKVEVQLLDERIRAQESSTSSLKNGAKTATPDSLQRQLSNLDGRINQLEKVLERAATDLKQINAAVTTNAQKIEDHQHQLDEVVKLKSTLMTISQAIKKNSLHEDAKVHKVKSGDSLEKIARLHHISIDSLKRFNQLETDRIIVGQELKIPNSQD